MADIFGDRAHLALTHRRRPGEATRLHALDALARRHGLRSLATGDVLYDFPDKRMLQDVVTAIREQMHDRRSRLPPRALRRPPSQEPGGDGAPLRAPFPTRSGPRADIAERCTFSLRELSYQYPDEIVMSGRTPQEALERLTRDALAAKFPEGVAARLCRRCSSMS